MTPLKTILLNKAFYWVYLRSVGGGLLHGKTQRQLHNCEVPAHHGCWMTVYPWSVVHHLWATWLVRVSYPKKGFSHMTSGRGLGNLVSFRSSMRLVDFLYPCLKNLLPPKRECFISDEITTQHMYFPKPVLFLNKKKFMPWVWEGQHMLNVIWEQL